MTTGVIFHAETPQQSLWGDITGWRNVLSKLNVDFYYSIDTTGDLIATEQPYRVTSLDEAIEKVSSNHPECKLVLLDMDSTLELKDFKHPKDVCYIFGPDSGNINSLIVDQKVKIYAHNLWAVICAGIVFNDRHEKIGDV